jgi:hypothetical protein
LLAQTWLVVQFAAVTQAVRQCWSGAHKRLFLHDDVAGQVTSAGNTQIAESLVFMQLWPAGQSVDTRQAVWHRPEVHTSEPVQSLLRMHVPPTSIFFAELQPAASHTETTTKPRTRDADISILQIGCHQTIAIAKGLLAQGALKFVRDVALGIGIVWQT